MKNLVLIALTLFCFGCQKNSNEVDKQLLFSLEESFKQADELADSGGTESVGIEFLPDLLYQEDTLAIKILNQFIDLYVEESDTSSPTKAFWSGRMEAANSFFTVYKADSIYSAAFQTDSIQYEIDYMGDGYQIKKVDRSAYVEEDEPTFEGSQLDSLINLKKSNLDEDFEDDDVENDSGEFIDVLVCYTKKAKEGAGGTTSQIKAQIGRAIVRANETYAISAVNHRLSLVGTLEVSYTESGNAKKDVEWAQSNATVKAERNKVKADVVMLIVESSSAGGRAYAIMDRVSSSFAPYAYAMSLRRQMSSEWTLAHEIGHLMGCRHTCSSSPKLTPFKHSHGYLESGEWRTVMAKSTDEDRIGKWSNPNLKHNNKPTGTSTGTCTANNASTLNKTAFTVANFRKSGVPN